jgi:hypothetical protein
MTIHDAAPELILSCTACVLAAVLLNTWLPLLGLAGVVGVCAVVGVVRWFGGE